MRVGTADQNRWRVKELMVIIERSWSSWSKSDGTAKFPKTDHVSVMCISQEEKTKAVASNEALPDDEST